MRTRIAIVTIGFACCLGVHGRPQVAHAQGYGSLLTMQGINHRAALSAASRGAGGLSIGLPGEPSLMFSNPTSLQDIEGFQFSVGAVNTQRSLEQTQQWLPLRNFPTFSLMMEGLIDQINDPDLTEPPADGFGPEDSIPRPYDLIKPDWSLTQPARQAYQGFAAAPIEIGDMKVVGGIGAVQYANLDYYYQNNNVLSPSIGTQRPVGVPLPAIGQEILVDWTQYLQERRGSIMGYGAAISVGLSDELSVGAGGLILDGQSDDYEMTVGRGRIRFGNDNNVFYHRLDSVYARTRATGSSDYSGSEFSLSGMYRGKSLTLSLVVKLPSRISRSFSRLEERDTAGIPASSGDEGSDEMRLPWSGSVGIAFAVRENLTFGFEYELRPYSTAEYTSPSGETSRPWLSSSAFRVGADFSPVEWLALRVGYRDEGEIFEEAGNALLGDPVRYSVYSVGLGFTIGTVRLNAAYEYAAMKYQDLWQTNINLNSMRQSTLTADISYVLK